MLKKNWPLLTLSIIGLLFLTFVFFWFCSIITIVDVDKITPAEKAYITELYFLSEDSDEITILSYQRKINIGWHSFGPGYTIVEFKVSRDYGGTGQYGYSEQNIHNFITGELYDGYMIRYGRINKDPDETIKSIEAKGKRNLYFSSIDWNAPRSDATVFFVIGLTLCTGLFVFALVRVLRRGYTV